MCMYRYVFICMHDIDFVDMTCFFTECTIVCVVKYLTGLVVCCLKEISMAESGYLCTNFS